MKKLGAIRVNFLLNQQEGRTLVGVMKVKRLTTALVIHRAKPSVIFWREKSLELNLCLLKNISRKQCMTMSLSLLSFNTKGGEIAKASCTSKELVLGKGNNREKWDADAVKAFLVLEEMNLAFCTCV